MQTLPDPKSEIDAFIQDFDTDVETKLHEQTLTHLIGTFKENRSVQEVLIKVIAINTIYRSRVLNIDLERMAKHIVDLDLDDRLNAGDPTIVKLIYECKGARHMYYSFATKYCSWHNHEAYSIYDGNAEEALWAYRKQKAGFSFKRNDVGNYPRLVEIVKHFQAVYRVDSYTLKDVDKFLWLVGDSILKKRKSTAFKVSETD